MTSFNGAFIDNAWTGGTETIDVVNPANAEVIGTISPCGPKEAEDALSAAQRAAATWGALSIDAREAHIEAWKAKLLENKAEIVDLLVAETGKVTGNAEYDFTMLVDCLSYHVAEARRSYGTVIPSPDGSALSYTRYTPVGVVVAVLTWNFPLLNLGYKLGPILASGCTAVIKPSEFTPLATSRCLELLKDSGMPAGVLNLVNGEGIALVEPPTCPRRHPGKGLGGRSAHAWKCFLVY